MNIFELPSKRKGGTRVATLGSCRVRNPFLALQDTGELKICDYGLSYTHGLGEARQALEAVKGARTVPAEFSPYVYGAPTPPPVDRLARTLAAGVDVYVVEVSSPRQFECEGVFLQQNFLSRSMIQPHGRALLSWFRALASPRGVNEGVITEALGNLRESGFEDDGLVARVLHGARMTKPTPEALEATLCEMMRLSPGRWVVTGAIIVPGAGESTMADRRTLNEKLKQVCKTCGALFHEPGRLVAAHGARVAMDGEGASIHEYSIDFYPAVGRDILAAVDKVFPRAGDTPASPSALADRTAAPDRINSELITLHETRLAELGTSASGLFAHYEALLARRELITTRDRAALALIEWHIPDFDAYAVMRAGLGELAFLLAASGRKVVAHEPNAMRRSAIEAGLAHLRAVGLIKRGMLSISAELTPSHHLHGRVLGVGLDVSEFRDEDHAAPHLERAAGFTSLLIDPRLFLRLREGLDEQDKLLSELGRRGFGGRREYLCDSLAWLWRAS